MANKYVVIHDSAADNFEAIRLCGSALYKAGIVREEFAELCVEREKGFPTGLPTEIPTAIPHVKDEGITENAICLLKLDNKVTFRRMDDDNESVETDMEFNLAIKDPNEHLAVLQNMKIFLNDTEVLTKCRDLSDEETIAFLQERLG